MCRNFLRPLALALFATCACFYAAQPLSAQISLGTASSFRLHSGRTDPTTAAPTVPGHAGMSTAHTVNVLHPAPRQGAAQRPRGRAASVAAA
mgnify:CR=1 FL=1